ncbi:GAF domain-containing protein [Mycolicibacterium sp. S2-37]|uniref:GAF domain-containing protein n=1 Tax=Mycolicibacterium sp. S2-37 TaxID=2810297 RepID=UPI001A9404BD|nr:GAF domain-containing protein [Mycolicibacterium sp. S2-37]MBO0679171.1 GAF domain-containing protein [Mycolicibacterium sp. S2-37]
MVAVYRAPMRSRDDDVDVAATIAHARAHGLCGFGERGVPDTRLDGRIARFAEARDGSFVWTRGPDGLFWLGRIDGAYFRDAGAAAADVDLVHVRPCRWLPEPLLEPEVPAAVLATYRRGGRNFQQTHDPAVGAQCLRLWEDR